MDNYIFIRGRYQDVDKYVVIPSYWYFSFLMIFAILVSISEFFISLDEYCSNLIIHFGKERFDSLESIRQNLGCKVEFFTQMGVASSIGASLYYIFSYIFLIDRNNIHINDTKLRSYIVLMIVNLFLMYFLFFYNFDVDDDFINISSSPIVRSEFILFVTGFLFAGLAMFVLQTVAVVERALARSGEADGQ